MFQFLVLLAQIASPVSSPAVWSPGEVAREPAGLALAAPTSRVWIPRPAELEASNWQESELGWNLNRYGIAVSVDASLRSSGDWDTAADGSAVWRLQIETQDAKSVGVEFEYFDLPEGAALFGYDLEQQVVVGPFESSDADSRQRFCMPAVPGRSLILELQLPATMTRSPSLSLGRVIYDFKGIEGTADSGGGEGSCSASAACPPGNQLLGARRATVRLVSGGIICSGVLLNNTAENLAPIIYSANHCNLGDSLSVRFNWDAQTCAGGFVSGNQNLSAGVASRISDPGTNGVLLLLDKSVPLNFDPYFLGWSRSPEPPATGVTFHHGGNLPKQICWDPDGCEPDVVTFLSFGELTGFRMNSQLGGTDTHAAGGGLIDQDGLVRGTLTTGVFDCSQIFFGGFREFWQNSDISTLLDPLGLDPESVPFLDPFAVPSGPPVLASISPLEQLAVLPEGPASISVFGSNLTVVTDVKINGESLPTLPPAWNVVSGTLLMLTPPQSTTLGEQTIELISPFGSASTTYNVVLNSEAPALDLELSEPAFLISALGLNARVGSNPGDLAILAVATSGLPSSLPGLLELGIGNQFTEVYDFGSKVVDATSGYASFSSPLNSTLPIGLKLYVQAIALTSPSLTLPLPVTNVQVGTLLF